MTEKQYKEVISLDKRLTELKEMYNILNDKNTYLSYYQPNKLDSRSYFCDFEKFSSIKDILKRFKDTLCSEVKNEIESIKKRISEI